MSSSKPPRRMTAEKRRDAILQAALPLFAQHGQDGVTTLELAKACGVSEALLFRHFPTKQVLFEAIRSEYSHRRGPVYPQVNNPEPPSTESLVRLVCRFVHYVVLNSPTNDQQVMRLFYRSFIEDGKFARGFLAGVRVEAVRRDFEASLLAAREAGDALPLGAEPYNLFWFVQHTTTAACLMRLPDQPVVRYRGAFRAALHDLVRFTLRGVGVREEALTRLATAENFDRWIRDSAEPAGKPATALASTAS